MNKKIQKAVAIILGACTICSVLTFTACSKQDATKEESVIVTEKAKIKDADAINYIESYSSKQLGLTEDDRAKCSFMVASDGEEIDGKKYIKIIAAIKNEQKGDDGKTTYTFDTKGEYFISFNGDEVLKKSGDAYSKLELITTTKKENKKKNELEQKLFRLILIQTVFFAYSFNFGDERHTEKKEEHRSCPTENKAEHRTACIN